MYGVELDMNSDDSVDSVMPALISQFGSIDALVNNAGFGVWGPIQSLSIDELKTQFEANFFGAVRMIHAVLPTMIERGEGRIVNISSVLGRFGTPFNGAYVASKFALEGISESLRIELAPLGVHVSVVEPGLFETDFQIGTRYAPRAPTIQIWRMRPTCAGTASAAPNSTAWLPTPSEWREWWRR